MIVLALESSTSSAKAMLYDNEHGVLAARSVAYPVSISAGGVCDTKAVTTLTLELGREIAQGQPVQAVAICATWHSVSLCRDSLENPGKAYLWNFLEPSGQCTKIRQDVVLTDELYRRTGCMPHMTYSRHALHYLASQGEHIQEGRLITQGGYTFYALTGEWRESISTMCGWYAGNSPAMFRNSSAMRTS